MIIFSLLFFTVVFVFPRFTSAYLQSEDMCYSQCAAYKFVWQGDYCYDLFRDQCATSDGNTIKETVSFLKSIKGILEEGEGVENVFKAWFVCKPLIENCIAPQLASLPQHLPRGPVYLCARCFGRQPLC